jgi:hypothetical protein
VKLAHHKTPINTAHTKATPSRFSAGPNATVPFEILYLAETQQVAQFEIGALAGDPLAVGGTLNAPGSFSVVHVKVVLHYPGKEENRVGRLSRAVQTGQETRPT